MRVVRDRWGVPHITAASVDDLFVAQGFVQAGDRLFQMDLWRRSAQGRLSEVLGINFLTRDAMTRRVQDRGDINAEWAGYPPGTRAIATAFVRGINAWVTVARQQPPEEFARAGWLPEFWEPEDLLNRTDAFLGSGDALAEAFRARLVASGGSARAGALLAGTPGDAPVFAPGLDARTVTAAVSEALRSAGTDPFFTVLAGGSNAWVVSGRRSVDGAPLVAVDPHRAYANPSLRYLVHLTAPGWNVIGATAPWLPGVVIGHNDRVAWGMTAMAGPGTDTQDLFVDRLNPDNRHQVEDHGRWINTRVVLESMVAKGRPKVVRFLREYTPHGVIVAVDGEKNLAFSLRWSGMEPGAAGELGALAIDRAGSAGELRAALGGWKMPAAEFVYADRDGGVGSQVAGLVPIRAGADWTGWRALDDLPHTANPASGYVASANDSAVRTGRLRDVLGGSRTFSIDDFVTLQHDVVAVNAARLVPLLTRVRSARDDVERARQQLVRWDRRMAGESAGATIYAEWEQALRRTLADQRVDSSLADELAARTGNAFVEALTEPSRVWFDGNVVRARDALLLKALTIATDDLMKRGGPAADAWLWRQFHAVTFAHPLGITPAARARFNAGPFPVPGFADTVMATGGPGLGASVGASFAAVMDVGSWDRSVAMNAPGQSGSPASTHFKDLAARWAAGTYFPLAFSEAAVQANAESTLMLVPGR